jgi:RyR domain
MHAYSDEEVAQIAHYAIRGLQSVQNDPGPAEPWAVLSPDARASVIAGVRAARSGASPRGLHDAWIEHRRLEGWIPGEIKDPVLRTHPNLVPWEELSPAEQDKDVLFLMVVTALTLDMRGMVLAGR